MDKEKLTTTANDLLFVAGYFLITLWLGSRLVNLMAEMESFCFSSVAEMTGLFVEAALLLLLFWEAFSPWVKERNITFVLALSSLWLLAFPQKFFASVIVSNLILYWYTTISGPEPPMLPNVDRDENTGNDESDGHDEVDGDSDSEPVTLPCVDRYMNMDEVESERHDEVNSSEFGKPEPEPKNSPDNNEDMEDAKNEGDDEGACGGDDGYGYVKRRLLSNFDIDVAMGVNPVVNIENFDDDDGEKSDCSEGCDCWCHVYDLLLAKHRARFNNEMDLDNHDNLDETNDEMDPDNHENLDKTR